ncbi:hypothetical protein GH733_004082 [Mirounga leonina]|nr:hypothetical protein GH733_004082 [Mirounga leonina]
MRLSVLPPCEKLAISAPALQGIPSLVLCTLEAETEEDLETSGHLSHGHISKHWKPEEARVMLETRIITGSTSTNITQVTSEMSAADLYNLLKSSTCLATMPYPLILDYNHTTR